MDLTTYVDTLRRELVVAAEAGGDEARELAERLVSPLDSATRLVLLEAFSDAADEITRELAPGSVEVRIRGRDAEFVVTAPPPDEPLEDQPRRGLGDALAGAVEMAMGLPLSGSGPQDATDEGGTTRLTLRLPTHLKPRMDEAANRAGLSVNAWLVRVVTAALQPTDRGPDPTRSHSPAFGRHYTGWVR